LPPAREAVGDERHEPLQGAEAFCRRCGGAIFADAEICPHCGVRQLDAPGEAWDWQGHDLPAILSLIFGSLGLLRFFYVLALLPTLLSLASLTPWFPPIAAGVAPESPERRQARKQFIEATELLRDAQAWSISATVTYGTPLSLIALVLAYFAKPRLRPFCLWLSVVPILTALGAVFVINIYVRSLPITSPF
jgi:hypothetical protein